MRQARTVVREGKGVVGLASTRFCLCRRIQTNPAYVAFYRVKTYYQKIPIVRLVIFACLTKNFYNLCNRPCHNYS